MIRSGLEQERLLVVLAGFLCVGAWAVLAVMPASEATARRAPAAAGPAQGYTESGLIRAPVLGQFGGTFGPVLPDGEIVFVGAGNGLAVFDFGRPPSFDRLIGQLPLPTGLSRDMFLDGRYLYVLGWYELVVMDVADPANPTVLATRDGPWALFSSLGLGGGTLFVSTDSGLAAFDVSDPVNPREQSRLNVADDGIRIDDLAVSGTTAYLAALHNGVHGVDVADPTHMRSLGAMLASEPERANEPGTPMAMNVEIGGNRLGVGQYQGGLAVVDVTDPRQPGKIERGPFMALGGHLVVADQLAWVVCLGSGLWAVDISDARAPRPVVQVASAAGTDVASLPSGWLVVAAAESGPGGGVGAGDHSLGGASIYVYYTCIRPGGAACIGN